MSERKNSFFQAVYRLLAGETEQSDDTGSRETLRTIGAGIGLLLVLLIYWTCNWVATRPHAFLNERLSPDGVLDLRAAHERNKLTSFKGLRFPAGVKEVDCSKWPYLTSLEGLPAGVEKVNCSGCPKLTSLEGLPVGVKEVDFTRCTGLTSLEGLPVGIERVNCWHCEKLTSLKGLPPGVKEVHCGECYRLTSLKGLPVGVKEVDFTLCIRLTSLGGAASWRQRG